MHDPEDFLERLAPHRARLVAISRSLVRRQADADDALQEALLRAWEDFPRYRDSGSFGAWVLRYLVNTVRNRNRRLHHELEVSLAPEPESAEAILSRELEYERFFRSPESILETLEDRLAGAIRALSPAERAVLLLRAVGELSYREIGDALSMPEGTAMSHLSRARKRLRSLLGQRGAHESRGEEGGPARGSSRGSAAEGGRRPGSGEEERP